MDSAPSLSTSMPFSSSPSRHPFSPLASEDNENYKRILHPLSGEYAIDVRQEVSENETGEVETQRPSQGLEEPLIAKARAEGGGKATASGEERVCRICYGDLEDGPLISPCACTGAMASIHTSCLRKW